jgi:hypothetical protein
MVRNLLWLFTVAAACLPTPTAQAACSQSRGTEASWTLTHVARARDKGASVSRTATAPPHASASFWNLDACVSPCCEYDTSGNARCSKGANCEVPTVGPGLCKTSYYNGALICFCDPTPVGCGEVGGVCIGECGEVPPSRCERTSNGECGCVPVNGESGGTREDQTLFGRAVEQAGQDPEGPTSGVCP